MTRQVALLLFETKNNLRQALFVLQVASWTVQKFAVALMFASF